jgi:hypothetical protein
LAYFGVCAGKTISMHIGHFHRRHTARSGYVLMAILFFMTLLIVGLMATAPAIKTEIQRDREMEMIHRGAQYSRAIKKYFKKFGRYPTSIDQLKETNNIRFLRREYKDPMSPDGTWRVLHVGDIKLGPTSSLGTPVSAMVTGGGPSGGLSANPSQPGGVGGSPGMNAPGNPTSSTPAPVFGGGTIIGVASVSEKEGLHEFNEKTHYNEWYFAYDPTTDRGGLINGPYTSKTFGAGTALGQQQPGASGQPSSLGQPSGFGQPSTLGQPSSFGPPGPAQQPPPNPR